MSNILHTPERLQAALALIEKGITRPSRIAKGIGVSYRTYCNWMVRSGKYADPAFLVNYNDVEMQFAVAISLATRVAFIELRGLVIQESIFGYDEETTKDGQVVWAIDPEAAALPEDCREFLGYRKDALRVVDGKLVPHTVRKKAPVAQQLRVLEVAFPKDWRPGSTQDITVNGQVAVGVGHLPKQNYAAPPPRPLAEPPMPQIEGNTEAPLLIDADFEEVDETPTTTPQIVIAPQIALTEPEPVVIRDQSPPQEHSPISSMAFSAAPQRAPRSALERDLFEELAKARAKAGK